ncbi:right-handed parallel beta-helix repeat-containing protein, partial [Candidatus Poribacteria bacterium]|nr:right-handed parallel beta-helix repeat-containing protein [Candidatus Poribacteria bacterium]
RGLSFSHTEWWLPKDSETGGFSQAAVGVPGSIYGVGAKNIVLENCQVAHIGNYAIELARGCQKNRVIKCNLFDMAAGGLKIGETGIRDNELEQTYGNEISNCQISEGGIIFHPAIGIWVGQSYDNLMAHNHIHDFYYSGFSVGWTWGYGKTLAKGNIVEFNHVHHIGIRSNGDGPILSDMGGIYTLGMQPGTIIRNNIFHDIAGLKYGGWGIYLDEGSTHIIVENNLVYRTTHGGFHQHYGKENIIRNNIFAFGRDQQIQCSRPENHIRFIFEGNIVYWKEGKLLAGNIDFNFVFDKNIYWREGGGEILFGDMSLEKWQEKGMDKNSIIADPLFSDPEKDDYQLKPNSPAINLGFKL